MDGPRQVLYMAPDAASANAFEAMLEDFSLREFTARCGAGPRGAEGCTRELRILTIAVPHGGPQPPRASSSALNSWPPRPTRR